MAAKTDYDQLVRDPMTEVRGLLPTSTAILVPFRGLALVSSVATSGLSDNQPVLAQHAEPGAFDREHFTWERVLSQNAQCSVVRVHQCANRLSFLKESA